MSCHDDLRVHQSRDTPGSIPCTTFLLIRGHIFALLDGLASEVDGNFHLPRHNLLCLPGIHDVRNGMPLLPKTAEVLADDADKPR